MMPGRFIFGILSLLILINYALMLHLETRTEVKILRLVQKGACRNAAPLLDKLESEQSRFPGGFFFRPWISFHLKRFSEAEQQLDAFAVKVTGDSTATRLGALLRAVCALAAGRDPAAFGELDRPATPLELEVAAMQQFARRDFNAALDSINESVKRNPGNVRYGYYSVYSPAMLFGVSRAEHVHTVRAMILVELGRYGDAIDDASFALQKDSTFSLAYLVRGYAEIGAGRVDAAKQSFDMLLESQPNEDDTLVDLINQRVATRSILLPSVALSLFRKEGGSLQNLELSRTVTLENQQRFPSASKLLPSYSPSPSKERKEQYRRRDERVLCGQYLGIGFLLVVLGTWWIKRDLVRMQKVTKVPWTEIRVRGDVFHVDMVNHLVASCGISLIACASFRIVLPTSIRVIAGFLLLLAWLRTFRVTSRVNAAKRKLLERMEQNNA